MTAKKPRARMTAQRERVFSVRGDVLRMLDDGVSMPEIQRRLRLEDMPKSTFHYLAAKLRDAPRAAPTQAVQPAPPRSPETAKDDIQPERVSPQNPDADEPRKPAPKKRRRGVVISQAQGGKEDLNLDPSKW